MTQDTYEVFLEAVRNCAWNITGNEDDRAELAAGVIDIVDDLLTELEDHFDSMRLEDHFDTLQATEYALPWPSWYARNHTTT